MSDIEQNTDDTLSTAVVTWTAPTASDNSGSVTLTSNHEPGDTFPIGMTVVRYIATDPDSNAAMTSFTVTITGNVKVDYPYGPMQHVNGLSSSYHRCSYNSVLIL